MGCRGPLFTWRVSEETQIPIHQPLVRPSFVEIPGSMKLIIERIDGTVYAYRESNKQFRKMEPQRNAGRLMNPEQLDHECCLESYSSDFHMVFDIKRKRAKKRK
jgi:hypothetical protein